MTRAEFDSQMRRMVGLRFAPPLLDTHWEGLQGIPADVLEKAISHAIITRRDFPTPAELREDCDKVTPAQDAPSLACGSEISADLDVPIKLGELPNGAPIFATKEVRHYCDRCGDGGWESLWCGHSVPPHLWYEKGQCGRFGNHSGHEFVQRCACWDSNPSLLRRRDAARRYSSKDNSGGRGVA